MSDGEPSGPAPAFRLRLFVAGGTELSRRAIENLRGFRLAHLAGEVDIAVVDIYQQPDLATLYQVVAVPTLVKLLPPPVRRIIGDLSDADRVLRGLGLAPLGPMAGRHDG